MAEMRFSGFNIVEEDTVPPDMPPRQQLKYGILPKLTERKRWRAINTVEMVPLFASKPDTTQAFIVLGDSVEEPVSDVSREPIRTEINQDQVSYFLILGPYLPKPKPKKESKAGQEVEDEKLKKLMEKQERAEIRAFEKEERRKKRKGEIKKVPYLLPEELLDEFGNDPRQQRKPIKPQKTEEEEDEEEF